MLKIKVTPNNLGHLLLEPVSKSIAKAIAANNAYDHSSDVYLQDQTSIDEFLYSIPKAKKREINKGWNVTILMDDWTYIHMVGGN